MDPLIDSTFLPLLLKSIGFLMFMFLLWPIARRQSAALQSIYWRCGMLGLLILGVFSLWVPVLTIDWAGAGRGRPQPDPAPVPLQFEAPSAEWKVLELGDERSISTGPIRAMQGAESASVSVINPLLALWMVGSALLSIRWVVARVRLSRLCSPEPQQSH